MSRTKFSDLFKLVALSFLVGLSIANIGFIPINSLSPIAMGLLVIATLIWVTLVTNRLPKTIKSADELIVKASKNPLPPLSAARTVAFALAGSRAGAILLGCFGGIATTDIFQLQIKAHAERAINSGVSAVFSFLMILISLSLEKKCSPPLPKPAE